MSHPVTVMWTVPRSVSTSFERMMIERRDHTVLDEPFSRSYYFSPDRRSDRYTEDLPDSTYDEVLEQIDDAARERPVFVKDMAYQAAPVLDADLVARYEHCFLVRHPAATLRSLARTWPDHTDDEAGWAELGRVADLLEDAGRPLVVVDANRLCDDPPAVVAAWCGRMGLEHRPEAMTWEAGMQPQWEIWGEWHASSARATGFAPLRPPPAPPGPDADPRRRECFEAALPVYERLLAHAVGPSS